MAQDLTNGVWTESFDYGYPYSQVLGTLPPEFDYEGTALTNAGVVTCAPGLFSLEYGTGPDNPDASAPYGGSGANPYYLRFPVVSWGETVGIFLTITTADITTLSFDRAFSGYVGDRLSVVVNDIERISITGTAGYPWTRSTITIGQGVNKIAILLNTASYTPGSTVREGVSQTSTAAVELLRFLRISNLSIDNVAALPTANNQIIQMVGSSTMTANVTVGVRTPMTLSAVSWQFWPAKVLAPTTLAADSSISADTVFPGRWVQQAVVSDSVVSANLTVQAHAVSDTGGFAVDSSASLIVVSMTPVDVKSLIRPLIKTTLTMDRPIIVGGRPVTPIASCETEVDSYADEITVLSKVDPVDAPNNVLPVAPTYRWLSLDAHADPDGQLIEWHGTNWASDPVWTTPGTHRPEVGNFAMKTPTGQVTGVRYPAVQFDSASGEHLNIDLVHGSSTMTWVFVGSFFRYRGALADSCPIIDLSSNTVIDYTTETTALRGAINPWADNEPQSSIYLGLTSYGTQEPTTSQLAFRTSDATSSYGRSNRVVITDSTPVVMVYCLNGANSYVSVTPIVVGQNNAQAQMVASFARDPLVRPVSPPALALPAPHQVTLGKSRMKTPFGGNFLTGSMSLLEVDFFNRALSLSEATDVSNFLAGLYTPTSADHLISDFTAGRGNVDTEQCLIYAADPETPLALITGSKCVVTDVFISTPDGQSLSSTMSSQGVPTVECSNRDYAAIVATLKG